ncbi:MAG: Gfo/Idh/MocA family oxidoreductase [Planctomycetes bacterium]|nr:Gfo/Idh/MocA family oxidoreductase [Planctomycetota bacterium]
MATKGHRDGLGVSRRDMLKGAIGGAAVGLATFGIRGRVLGAAKPLTAGLIGCGGRGTGAANDLLEAAGKLGMDVRVTALGDVFEDRLNGCADNLRGRKGGEVPKDRMFIGLDAYKKVIDSGVDIVILATPPGFRPEHFEACVAAGKNVFTEKPVATFAQDARRFLAAAKASVEKKLTVVAGTQRRHQRPYVETMKRIHDGAIGEIRALRAYWCGTPVIHNRARRPDWTDMEFQLRNWYSFVWICGDHIVEQHVHNLDVCNWAMKGLKHPIAAFGSGGCAWRPRKELLGNIYDNYSIDFEYEGGVHMLSMCRQYNGSDTNVSEFIVGSEGESSGTWLFNKAKNERFNGPGGENPYVQEHMDMLVSIVEGQGLNESENVCYSTMTAIMGRISAFTGKKVTWDQMMKIEDSEMPSPMTWDVEIPVPPLAVPGVFKIKGINA